MLLQFQTIFFIKSVKLTRSMLSFDKEGCFFYFYICILKGYVQIYHNFLIGGAKNQPDFLFRRICLFLSHQAVVNFLLNFVHSPLNCVTPNTKTFFVLCPDFMGFCVCCL